MGEDQGTVVRFIPASAAVLLLFYYFRGGDEAMNEGIEIALYVFAFFAAAVVPTFLWNLWLAPYRVLNDRLDELAKSSGGPRGSLTVRATNVRLDVKLWDGTRIFKLGDAACLWVNVPPGDPIEDYRAMGRVPTRGAGALAFVGSCG